jgi:A/G-specific adenine glycosylase
MFGAGYQRVTQKRKSARLRARKVDPGEGNAPYVRRLLDWYDRHARHLAWRARPGEKPEPYHVWLSEIMLQQTTVAAVTPYYEKFLTSWPHVGALASASQKDVMTAWAGLGYYARARNLHACARAVCRDYAGAFPQSEEELRRLPGIGPYTAAAISAIAFDRPATVVDGNVERVVARLFAIDTPLPLAKKELHAAAACLTPTTRPGDFAQAMMDLGAMLCTPRTLACHSCPLADLCIAYQQGIAASLPRRGTKPRRPERRAVVYWLVRPDGAVLLQRRPPQGLLGGMMEFPSSPWKEQAPDGTWNETDECRLHAPLRLKLERIPGSVRHIFTHFALECVIYKGHVSARALNALGAVKEGGSETVWVKPNKFSTQALPSLMHKIARAVDASAQSRV